MTTPREHGPVLLIVDDEPRILSALRRTLRREGFEIFAAESAREALRILDEQPVHLILSDHKMPGMTGMQLLAQAAQRWPAAARILITGWTESIPEQEIRAVGLRAIISKPWDDAELKEILRTAAKELP
ncbi:MAG: response regulator [Myxococcales bacterium]|nr:response regulator [Myxococcales bacterium]MDH5308079.1 response regulator [Myxococcales bacterium]MDH5566973.1 response regulator [Myxococcales bacterium]